MSTTSPIKADLSTRQRDRIARLENLAEERDRSVTPERGRATSATRARAGLSPDPMANGQKLPLSRQGSRPTSRFQSPSLGKSNSLPPRYDSPGGQPSSAARLAVLETLVNDIKTPPPKSKTASARVSPTQFSPRSTSSQQAAVEVKLSSSAMKPPVNGISLAASHTAASHTAASSGKAPGSGNVVGKLLVGCGLGLVGKLLADKQEQHRQDKLRLEYLEARAAKQIVQIELPFQPPKAEELLDEIRNFFSGKLNLFQRLKLMLDADK